MRENDHATRYQLVLEVFAFVEFTVATVIGISDSNLLPAGGADFDSSIKPSHTRMTPGKPTMFRIPILS